MEQVGTPMAYRPIHITFDYTFRYISLEIDLEWLQKIEGHICTLLKLKDYMAFEQTMVDVAFYWFILAELIEVILVLLEVIKR